MENTWIQERYYSYLKAAIIQGKSFSNLELGIDLCSKAYNLIPTRAEAYFWSSQFNRGLKNTKTQLQFQNMVLIQLKD